MNNNLCTKNSLLCTMYDNFLPHVEETRLQWMKQTEASKISNEFHARTSRASANIDRSRVCKRFGKSPRLDGIPLSSRSPFDALCVVLCHGEKQSVKWYMCLAWHGWAREKTHLGANKLWPLLTRGVCRVCSHVGPPALFGASYMCRSVQRAAWEKCAPGTHGPVKCKVTLGVIAHGN